MVQTTTVRGRGWEAGVTRIKGTGGRAREGAGSATFNAVNGQRSTDFVGAATLAAKAEGYSPAAVEHSVLGKIISFVAQSTPEAEAVVLTGNADAANPVVSTTHGVNSAAVKMDSGQRRAADTKPERGLAMALAGNGRWCYLDPKLGAMHAVAEAARKVACTGATPVAATNCLNFGNPEKPEIMAQLSAAIDGIAEACTALGTPITGGNVSLYNETKGEGIYPTPVIGVVGILEDVIKAVPNSFQSIDDIILAIFPLNVETSGWEKHLGSSEYARVIHGTLWGCPPALNLHGALLVNQFLIELADRRLLSSAADVGSGGAAVTIVKCGLARNIGAQIALITEQPSPMEQAMLYLEDAGSVIVTCKPGNEGTILELARQHGVGCSTLGLTVEHKLQCDDIGRSDSPLVWSLNELRAAFTSALEPRLDQEVLA